MSIMNRLITFADEIPAALEAQQQPFADHLELMNKLPDGPEKKKVFESFSTLCSRQLRITEIIRTLVKEDEDQQKVNILSGTKS